MAGHLLVPTEANVLWRLWGGERFRNPDKGHPGGGFLCTPAGKKMPDSRSVRACVCVCVCVCVCEPKERKRGLRAVDLAPPSLSTSLQERMGVEAPTRSETAQRGWTLRVACTWAIV